MTSPNVETAAFDGEALSYDQVFSTAPAGRAMRDTVWRKIRSHVSSGTRVLDIGCGTGVDAEWYLARGAHVHGIDASSEMLAHCRQRTGSTPRAHWTLSDLNRQRLVDIADPDGYDLVVANFGVLNCIRDRGQLLADVVAVSRPGAQLFLVVMGPVCPIESIWLLARGRFGQAFRRRKGHAVATLAGGSTIDIWYPSIRTLRTEMPGSLVEIDSFGVGVVIPPIQTAATSAAGRVLLRAVPVVGAIDRRLGQTAIGRNLADHYCLHLAFAGQS